MAGAKKKIPLSSASKKAFILLKIFLLVFFFIRNKSIYSNLKHFLLNHCFYLLKLMSH